MNDSRGNPIEISAVIVWKVEVAAQALFDVDNYEQYVKVQSESAIRHLATSYPYDQSEGEEISLRSSITEVSESLGKRDSGPCCRKPGVAIEEARINHLAYAPEIANAMLQRQQAEAVISARAKIVDGAVGMVEMALKRLTDDDVIKLNEEQTCEYGQQPAGRPLLSRIDATRGQCRIAVAADGCPEVMDFDFKPV